MLNYVVVMGRLTKDPELKTSASGTPFVSFTVACSRDHVESDGERKTDFIDVIAWRKNAEFLAKWFHKGDMICVEGRWQTRSWEKEDGTKRRKEEILARHLNFCEGKKRESNDSVDSPKFAELPDEDFIPFL